MLSIKFYGASLMRIEFERCRETETKHSYHRYYKAIKYEKGNRYIPKISPSLYL